MNSIHNKWRKIKTGEQIQERKNAGTRKIRGQRDEEKRNQEDEETMNQEDEETKVHRDEERRIPEVEGRKRDTQEERAG